VRQQRETVTLIQPQAPQVGSSHKHLSEQLSSRKRSCLAIAQFLQHDSIARAL
jgi:hypothetical protein